MEKQPDKKEIDNKNVFTSKKVSAGHSNKNNCHSNNNKELTQSSQSIFYF